MKKIVSTLLVIFLLCGVVFAESQSLYVKGTVAPGDDLVIPEKPDDLAPIGGKGINAYLTYTDPDVVASADTLLTGTKPITSTSEKKPVSVNINGENSNKFIVIYLWGQSQAEAKTALTVTFRSDGFEKSGVENPADNQKLAITLEGTKVEGKSPALTPSYSSPTFTLTANGGLQTDAALMGYVTAKWPLNGKVLEAGTYEATVVVEVAVVE